MNNVLIAVPEDELIVSLFSEYIVRHNMGNSDTRLAIKAFSDYIQEYMIDKCNLDEEETDA